MQTYKENLIQGIVEMVNESWRLYRYTSNLVSMIADAKMQKKGQNQITRFYKHMNSAMEKMGIEIVDMTGMVYETGLPVYPINLGDFPAEEELVIELMMEPTIKRRGSAEIVKKGAVVLGRREA